MPHQVDRHVGQRLRQRRQTVGATQQQVASRVGVKFQQLHKYESGQNRIGASRLWDLANVLDVPVSHFFEGLASQYPDADRALRLQAAEQEARALVRTYYGIPQPQRRQLLTLARTLSEAAADTVEHAGAGAV